MTSFKGRLGVKWNDPPRLYRPWVLPRHSKHVFRRGKQLALSRAAQRARRPVYGVFSQKAVRLLASTALHLAPRRGVASVSRARARRELLTAAARAKVSRFLSFGRTVRRTADHSKASCL